MIIFISGSINSGKSTVADIVAKKIGNFALLEVDKFHEMIEWMPIDQAVPLNLENAVSTIKNFVKNNINVVVPYPLSEKNYQYILEELKDVEAEKVFFTLAPKLEIALADRGERKLTAKEKERINYHYNIGIASPSFGEIIDNSRQSPEQTAEYMISRIQKI
ncbi:MAG: hypothetical protein WCX77_02230 [Candidatus Paceibacterota bacterium]|jgi:cytidylate kinase